MKNQLMSLFQFSFIYRRISTCFGPTGPSSGEFTQLFTQPLVQCLYRSVRMLCALWPVLVTVTKTGHNIRSTRTERHRYWTNGCVNSCVNSPEDGPVGPKHVEIRRYMNKIEIVTSVGFSFHMLKRCTVQKAQNLSHEKLNPFRCKFHSPGFEIWFNSIN